jgi:hypothetical protein
MKKMLLIVLLLIILAASWYARKKDADPTPVQTPQEQTQQQSAGESFEGTVTAYDTGCFADAECSVTISGKKVVLVSGRMIDPEPTGELVGVPSIGDLENKIGAKAQVFAKKISDSEYTLVGSTTYFVKIQ